MSLAELKNRQATLASTLLTVPINEGGSSGDRTLLAIEPGKLFLIYGLFLRCDGALSIIWKSGATAISGPILLASGETISVFGDVPIMKGRASGEDVVLNLSATVGIHGWLNVTRASL